MYLATPSHQLAAIFGLWLMVALASGCRSPQSSVRSGDAVTASSEPAVKRQAMAHAHYATAVVHELNGRMDEALTEFARAVELDPENEALALEVSLRFIRAQRLELALPLLQQTARRPNASAEAHARLGAVYTQLNRLDEAVQANRLAVRKQPKELMGYQNLYFNRLQQQRPAEALRVLDQAARQTQVDITFSMGLAELYGHHVRQYPTQREAVQPKALVVLRRVDARELPGRTERLQLADAYYAFGDLVAARQLYADLVSDFEEEPEVIARLRMRLADLFLRDEQRVAALAQLEAVLREQPENAHIHYLLGSLALAEEQLTRAVQHLQQAILFNPRLQAAYFDLAVAQVALEQPDAALDTLGRARAQFAASFLLEYLTGMAEQERKHYDRAVECYLAAELLAKTAEPERLTPLFYFQVGAAHERQGDIPRAVEYLQEALRLSPDFPDALNYLGYVWAERGENLKQAHDYIRRALAAEPENAAYLDSMAWVLYQQGKPAEALPYMHQALAHQQEPDATLYDHLGDIHAALGQWVEARAAWQKSIAIEPSEAIEKKLRTAHP